MKSVIKSVGAYLPEKILTNQDLEKMVDTNDEWIVQRTGIGQRHIASENENTSDLATKAALDCLKNAGISAGDIDGIIVATTTPDLTMPSTACLVQAKIGMGIGFAFDVQAVCTGFIYALAVGNSLIKTGMAKKILVIGADTMSRIIDWKDRTTCVLFGDGAGAMILEASKEDDLASGGSGIIDTKIYSDGSYADLLYADGGVSSTQSSGCIKMNGSEVFRKATANLSSLTKELLSANNVLSEDLDFFIPHQANVRIIDYTANKIKIAPEKVVKTIFSHGNTSAASIPLAFYSLYKDNVLKQGDLILTEGMGSGFTWGGALIRW